MSCSDLEEDGVVGGPDLRDLYPDAPEPEVSADFDDVDEWGKSRFQLGDEASPAVDNDELGVGGGDWIDPPARMAFRGLAGEFVKLVSPHSEADPASLLVQFLVCFGNTVGRRLFRTADGARHHMNLFAVLVGKSSKARKGTSWAQVKRLFTIVAPEWLRRCVISGLSTGEGLIHAVRDESRGTGNQRLLVIEAEFARVLKVNERRENTLSPVIRQAWDDGDLSVLTKKNPARATGAHISIVGHITHEDLTRNLNFTEIANGFANRFMWFAVRRSQLLPFGGSMSDEELEAFAATLRAAIDFAQSHDSEDMEFSDKARRKWEQEYPALSAERDGLLGSITSRAEAQVLRLACIYAALDRSTLIKIQHLNAALALWDYSLRSSEFIFGSSTLGDSCADAILEALRSQPDGLTRTEINHLFSGNVDKHEIDAALKLLRTKRLATCETENTGGRPTERWVASTG